MQLYWLQKMYFLILHAPKLIYLLPRHWIGIQQALNPIPQLFIFQLPQLTQYLCIVDLSLVDVYACGWL